MFNLWVQKQYVWGPGLSPMHPHRNLEPYPGPHAPNWIFWSHFIPNSTIFHYFCKVVFFRTIRVFGIHKFLQMLGLHGLPCTPKDAPWKVPRSWIWNQNLPKNIFQAGPKVILELVRPKVVSAIFTSDQSFCRTEFLDHSHFRSSHISSCAGSLRALMYTNGCASKSWDGGT